MSLVRRAAVVLSAVLLAWPLTHVLAQRVPVPPVPPTAPAAAEPADRPGEDDFTLPTDSRLAVKPWWPSEIVEWTKSNRLAVFDLSAGCKSVWPKDVFTDPKSELADSVFLGPPLPLDGRLYVLAEKDRDLRLLCLENIPGEVKGNWKPRVVFLLPLGTVSDDLSATSLPRRIHAAPLAYGDGVLVCPTHAGCVVGVDLLTRSVAWVHRYDRPAPPARPVMLFRPGLVQPAPAAPTGWINSAPVVSDGSVVFAAPDGLALDCLDLKTGAPRWKAARQDDDLYLAGAFDGRVVVVGKKTCRAFNLSDGKPAWSLTTGVPSGRGAAAGGVYYLPLKETESSKEPEVCAIDLAKGQIIAHAKAHAPEGKPGRQMLFGNLVFAGGVAISQTTDNVAVYPLLKTKLEEMDAQVAQSPNDPKALTDRAELRLETGKVAAAAEDLGKALDNNPTAAERRRMADLLKNATAEQQKDLEAIRRRLQEERQ